MFSPLQSIWSYLVHFDPIWSIQSTLVLFCPLWSYLVHIGLIQSILFTLVLFGWIWSHSVHFVHFGSIYFSPIRSILSTLDLICPFIFIWSTLLRSIQSTLLHLVQFGPFGPLWSIHFDLFLCIYIKRKWQNLEIVSWMLFISSHLNFSHVSN